MPAQYKKKLDLLVGSKPLLSMDSLMVLGMDTKEFPGPLCIFFLGFSTSRNRGEDRDRCFLLRDEVDERPLIFESLSFDILKISRTNCIPGP